MRNFRWIVVFFFAFFLTFGITAEARAAPVCAWSLEANEAIYVDGLTACAEAGSEISLVVRCVGAPNGGLVAPDGLGATVTAVAEIDASVPGGWDAAFPAKTGTFRFTAWVGEETETRDVTVVVPSEPPPEAFVTHGEFDPVRDEMIKMSGRVPKRARITVGGTFTPTLPTTTKPSGGFVVEAGGKPVASSWVGLQLTGLVGVEWGGAPINPKLLPTTGQATLVAHSEQLRGQLSITPHQVVEINLGLGIGAKTYAWGQQVIRQTIGGRVLVVEDSSDTVGVLVPTVSVDFMPHPNVVVGAGVDLHVPLAWHLSMGGSQKTTGQVEAVITPLRVGVVF